LKRKTGMLLGAAVVTTAVYLATAGGTPDESGAPASAERSRPGPASRPARVTEGPPPLARSAPLPDDYHVLLKRNLFTVGSRPQISARYSRATLPEDQFVLRGILHQSGRYTALIEDLSTRRVSRVVAGDTVARGTLRQVSFDGLEYQADGRPLQISIGQKLSGVAMADPVIAARPTKGSDGDRKGDRDRDRDRDREASKGDRGEQRSDAGRSATSRIETEG